MFVNFFLLCYALESSRPRLDFPLEDHGAAIFSSISFALVSLQRLSILSFLSYLSDRFIKSSLIQLWYAPFQVHGCIIQHGTDKCQTNVCIFKEKFRKFFKLCTMSGRGMRFIPLCTWHTSVLCAVFCI